MFRHFLVPENERRSAQRRLACTAQPQHKSGFERVWAGVAGASVRNIRKGIATTSKTKSVEEVCVSIGKVWDRFWVAVRTAERANLAVPEGRSADFLEGSQGHFEKAADISYLEGNATAVRDLAVAFRRVTPDAFAPDVADRLRESLAELRDAWDGTTRGAPARAHPQAIRFAVNGDVTGYSDPLLNREARGVTPQTLRDDLRYLLNDANAQFGNTFDAPLDVHVRFVESKLPPLRDGTAAPEALEVFVAASGPQRES